MKIKLFLSVLLLAAAITAHAQPNTTMHFIGGYSIPMGDMKGKFGSTLETFTVNADSNTYYLQNGFNFGLGIKYSPYRNKGYKIIGGVQYNSFSQSADYSKSERPQTVDYSLRIFTFSAGFEYSYITKTSKINPFVNAEITGNFFSGNYTETYSDGETKDLTLKSASRFGVQFGGGADIPLGHRLGIITGFKYNLANLIGKESTGDFGSEYSLNDKEGVVNNTKYINRSINYLYIYAGFTLYLGL